MNKAIKPTPLGGLVKLIMGQAPPSAACNFDGIGTPFVKAGEFGDTRPIIREWTTSPLRMARREDVLLCVVGATCGKINLGEECAIGRSVAAIRPDTSQLDQFYLFYFMMTLVERLRSGSVGAAQTVISKEMIETIEFPLVPLPEQRRIVGLLDEAFAGIATAKANAEKNLQNARALFESHLHAVFTHRGPGWVEKPISECFKVRSGDFLPAKAMVASGSYDVYGGNGVNGRHDQKNLSGENVVIGRVGAKCGNVRHVLGDIWVTDNAVYISEYLHDFDLGFLTRLLELKDLRSRANQMAQPVISYTTIKEVILEFPSSISEQRRITARLDALQTETRRLEALYARKLAALDELKAALLHQAFSGQL